MGISRVVLCHLSRGIRKIAKDRNGASAVEFAFIAPVFAAIAVPLADVTNYAVAFSEMQTAARSAIHYVMIGGADMTVAQSQGMTGWSNRPGDGTLSAVQACFCAGVSSDCNTACPDTTPPQSFVTVTTSATFSGYTFSTHQNFSEKVRTR
jgi:Flp pilus assembly protein TadG